MLIHEPGSPPDYSVGTGDCPNHFHLVPSLRMCDGIPLQHRPLTFLGQRATSLIVGLGGGGGGARDEIISGIAARLKYCAICIVYCIHNLQM